MSRLRTVSLTVLLPSLVGGCIQTTSGCGDLPDEEVERTEVVVVPPQDLADALEADGTLSLEACRTLCEESGRVPEDLLDCQAVGDASGAPATSFDSGATGDTGARWPELACTYVEVEIRCIGGRHHAAIATPSRGYAAAPLMAWLQGTTHAETASVKAFVALARELETLGAPDGLVRRCHEAACDEVAHARSIGDLLAARGGSRVPMRFRQVPSRSLTQLAVENAVEGCVKEVWAAAVAYWQATHAQDDGIRAAMAPIARDEARHGDLARAIHAWAMEQLDEDGRQQVIDAQAEAVEELLTDLDRPADPELVAQVGLPDREAAVALSRQLAAHLWVRDVRGADA